MPQSTGSSRTTTESGRSVRKPNVNRPNGGLKSGKAQAPTTSQDAFEAACSHLRRFGRMTLPGRKNGHRRWSEEQIEAAVALLRLYFFAPADAADQITSQEATLDMRVVGEVRRRFANACFVGSSIQGTPGQAQSWFEEVMETTVAFHVGRRKGKSDTNAAQAEAGATA